MHTQPASLSPAVDRPALPVRPRRSPRTSRGRALAHGGLTGIGAGIGSRSPIASPSTRPARAR
jgi:hypothetical protein